MQFLSYHHREDKNIRHQKEEKNTIDGQEEIGIPYSSMRSANREIDFPDSREESLHRQDDTNRPARYCLRFAPCHEIRRQAPDVPPCLKKPTRRHSTYSPPNYSVMPHRSFSCLLDSSLYNSRRPSD